MDVSDARYLLKLRSATIERHITAEAYTTAWFTAFLDRAKILLTVYKPQTVSMSKDRRIGAGEYDFASLDNPEKGVIVEIKPNYRSLEQLKESLRGQAYDYANSERRFRKGIIVVTNGFECVWQAVYCSTKTRGFRPASDPLFLRLDSAPSLIYFATDVLQPNGNLIDDSIARGFPLSLFLQTVLSYFKGTQSMLWQEILDQFRDMNQWDRRNNTKTYDAFRNLIGDLKRHQSFRDTRSARVLIRTLGKTEYRAAILRCFKQEFGEELPVEKVYLEVLKALKGLIPKA